MVRGNWQHRVEREEARKVAAKEKKQRAGGKKQCKIWFNELLSQFDRYDETVRSTTHPTLHVWSDMVPATSEPLLDQLDEEDARLGKRKEKEKGAAKKKSHPRSKDSPSEQQDQDGHQLLLCRRSFLKGKCEYKGKKFGCRYLHYSPGFKTLGGVLGDSIDHETLSRIESSIFDATPKDISVNHPGAMEFLYHCPSISIPSNPEETISNFVSKKLAENQIPASSVFYVALNNTLVFDRLQGGMLLDEGEFFASMTNPSTPLDRRTSSIMSDCSQDGILEAILHDLPAAVLEHILVFLPDKSVGAAAQVCRAWNNEIGQHSPAIWLQLLKRHSWPLPDVAEDGKHDREEGRSSFVEHYSMMRKMRSLSSATSAVVSRQTMQQAQVGYQDFSRRKNAPSSSSDCCVSVHGWSDNLVLVGYRQECTLRLFEASAVGQDTAHLRCKELVCHNVSPYQNTKKRNCELLAVDLDDHDVGCLCSVSSDAIPGVFANILVVSTRDEFLLGSSSEASSSNRGQNESLKSLVIDIGEATINYILSSDQVDDRLLPLFDYFERGGGVGRVDVKTSKSSLCACGYGRFLVEVSIAVPETLDDDGIPDDNDEMIQLDRKLVIFSSAFGAITWIGQSYPLHMQPHEAQESVNLALSRRGAACIVAARPHHSAEILVTEIETRGQVQPPRFLEAPVRARTSIGEEGYSFAESEGLLINFSEVISLDILVKEIDGELISAKSVITFFPIREDNHAEYEVLRLPLDYLAKGLHMAGRNHVVAFCTIVKPVAEGGEADNADAERFARADLDKEKTIAFVVCIKSRCIIGQVDFSTKQRLELGSCGHGCTVGLAIDSRGVAIAGDPVQCSATKSALPHGFATSLLSKKKKKSSRGKRSAKKDGFARGQSLRG